MQRVTVTLPDDLVVDLDIVSSQIGCSRSALVSLVLSEQLELLSSLASRIQSTSSEHLVVKRAKGESLELIEERYRELLDGFEMYN